MEGGGIGCRCKYSRVRPFRVDVMYFCPTSQLTFSSCLVFNYHDYADQVVCIIESSLGSFGLMFANP